MAKYTTLNQSANMIEKRVKELEAIADDVADRAPAIAAALDNLAGQVLGLSHQLRQVQRAAKTAAA